MKKLIYTLLLISASFWSCDKKEQTNFVFDPPVPLADPFILLHENTYYAYGTNAANGIEVYTSDDLRDWKKTSSFALKFEDSWGGSAKLLWAPEVYYIKDKNKFFMYYSSNEHLCVATSNSPLGPFKQDVQQTQLASEKAIDNSLFIDDNGKPYMYFVRFNDGNNIWVAELENDLTTIKAGTMVKCMALSQPWEQVWTRVVEAPFVVKHQNLYYMTYSANNYQSPFYGIGVATATSPNGPWTKYTSNPVFQKPKDLVGVGHNAIFKDKSGNFKTVFHAHRSKDAVHPRAMYVAAMSFTNEATPVLRISDQDIITAKIKR